MSAPAPDPGIQKTDCDRQPQNVLDVMRQIKAGSLSGKRLSPEDRQACVLHLDVEGLSVPEIAEFLGVHERTIKRDRRAIRESNALEHDPAMAGQMAGRLVLEADNTIARIRRAVRDKDTSPAVKVEAERYCFNVRNDMIARLQSLGFLPQAAQNVNAELTHHVGDLSSLAEMRQEIDRLEALEQAQTPPAVPATPSPTTDSNDHQEDRS